MDGPTRTTTTLSAFHSLPVNEDATTSDHAHLSLIPSSSSKASSVNVNGNRMPSPNSSPQFTLTAGSPRRCSPPCSSPSPFASVHLAALLEILAQKSAADGAICLVYAAANRSPLVSFAHPYLPTITAVLYSLGAELGRPRREAHCSPGCSSPGPSARRDGTPLFFGLSGGPCGVCAV
ncbi:hypothetical protein BM221_010304 [Beauveria bassiana]|uniref:Uncharacterized protein n=1 Tax=Beauveria bassiana TaxID=176275 RepID=A0A2N6N977_BEABA|nr:hypothetical protein BM221_010304 [Beauveria bassiana]